MADVDNKADDVPDIKADIIDVELLTCPICDTTTKADGVTPFPNFASLRAHVMRTHRKQLVQKDDGTILVKEREAPPTPSKKAQEAVKPVEEELSELPDERPWEDDLEGERLPQNLDHLNRLLSDHGIKAKRKIILRRMSATDSTDIVELMNSIRETGYNTDIQKSVIRLYCKFLGCLIPPLVHDRLADKEEEGYEDFRRTPYLRGDYDFRRRRDYGYESPDEDVDTGSETSEIIRSVKEVFAEAYKRDDNSSFNSPELKYLQSQMDSLAANNKALEAKLEEEKTKRMEQQMTALHDEVKGLKEEMTHQRTRSEFDVQMGRQRVGESIADKIFLANILQNADSLSPQILEYFGFGRRKAKQPPGGREEFEPQVSALDYVDVEFIEETEREAK